MPAMDLNWPQVAAWATVGVAATLLLAGGAARAALALLLIGVAGWMFAKS